VHRVTKALKELAASVLMAEVKLGLLSPWNGSREFIRNASNSYPL